MYPLVLVPIFLLFFAVLAYAWFYWQHAKERDADKSAAGEPPRES